MKHDTYDALRPIIELDNACSLFGGRVLEIFVDELGFRALAGTDDAEITTLKVNTINGWVTVTLKR